MPEPTPNEQQAELIESTEGIYLVDAGAGTGKTFAITRRYAEIVDQESIEPEDVLLVTFTRSAATEMKERIVEHSSYSLRELADASIQTFHSYCADLLQERGLRAPSHLGIDERITQTTQILEEDIIVDDRFQEFFAAFRDEHPEFADFYRILDDGSDLQIVIEQFASKGIIPTNDGWYRNSETEIDGEYTAFKEAFDDVNEPRNDGRKQSELREKLNGYGRDKTYLPDAPEQTEVRGNETKRAPDSTAFQAFHEDRDALKDFVHEVYLEYIEFALSRNYLTFGLLQVFAFVLLCEDSDLRVAAEFEYVMVDEFQDTSEIQFKLALLLAGSDNLCVVGDWKQSIFSFQYADVTNITDFEERAERFAAQLEDDQDRVGFEIDGVTRIELTENYRSTQDVLDFSEQALVTPASDDETIDESVLDDVVSLSSNAEHQTSRIEGIAHVDEHEAVLSTIQDIVGSDEYSVEDDNGEPRPPEFGDIAVFTRTRDYGRELLSVASEYDLPMAYDGGVELFRSDQAKILLAWLRILESDGDRGWAVVLEEAGYTLDEVKAMIATKDYPSAMREFAAALDDMETLGAVARRVFDRYGFTDEYADVILTTIQSIHDNSTLTRGHLIRFIERGIDEGSEHEVVTGTGVDSVTVQTIHTAKGLEYPIVILANMNEGSFPPRGGGASVIQYDEPVGLRQRKIYADVEAYPHVYHNWTHDVLRHCLTQDNDEERRLLYVAITRAEQHVIFAGGDEPNTFFEELPFEPQSIEPDVHSVDSGDTVQAQLPFTIVPPDGPAGETPHTLMNDEVFTDDDVDGDPNEGMSHRDGGRQFGLSVHDFAERYALGEDVRPDNEDEQHVKRFIDGLEGELHVEQPAVLPIKVDGERFSISGIVDLVHETPEKIEIIDYKTDRSRRAETEYRTQISVYYHVLSECFPEKSVTARLYYTAADDLVDIEPYSKTALCEIVATRS